MSDSPLYSELWHECATTPPAIFLPAKRALIVFIACRFLAGSALKMTVASSPDVGSLSEGGLQISTVYGIVLAGQTWIYLRMPGICLLDMVDAHCQGCRTLLWDLNVCPLRCPSSFFWSLIQLHVCERCQQ
jgi:hypothetical protein